MSDTSETASRDQNVSEGSNLPSTQTGPNKAKLFIHKKLARHETAVSPADSVAPIVPATFAPARLIAQEASTSPDIAKRKHGFGRTISKPLSESQPLLENRQNFLDPDDPKVSPLNLWRIRFLRHLLIFVLAFNLCLFFVVLVSQFFSIRGLGTQEALFLELCLILFSIVNGSVTLWCFATPVHYERVLGYICCVLVMVDLFVVLIVAPLRRLLGFFGVSVVFLTEANLTFIRFAEYSVENAKAEQEIKFTGRVETRKTISEILVTFFKVVSKFILLLTIWNISLTIWLNAFDSHEKPWGKLISVGEDQFQVHLACYGDVHSNSSVSAFDEGPRQPIVLVEGGQLSSVEQFQEWIQELFDMRKIERYCVWDRPGYAFSEGAPSPVSVGIITEYLLEALNKEHIDGPFSAVGFDIGGLYSKVFALRNPGQMHSILLVDSWHEDLLKHFPLIGSDKQVDAGKDFGNELELMNSWQGLIIWLKGLYSPLGLMRSLHWFAHPKKYLSRSRIYGSDMIHSSKYLCARLQEQITASLLSFTEVRSADISKIPLAVILSDSMIKKSLNWGNWQLQLSKLSTRSLEWVVAEDSNHQIWDSKKGRRELQLLLLRLISENSH